MLPLDDPRWKDIDHRGWTDGKQFHAGAPYVPEVLAQLLKEPQRSELFKDLWPYLCSEETVWPAAYAAAPYIIALARLQTTHENLLEYLHFLGCLAANTEDEGDDEFAEDYCAAIKEAATFSLQIITRDSFEHNQFLILLGTVAALHGCKLIGSVITRLGEEEAISPYCPNCEAELYIYGQETGMKVTLIDHALDEDPPGNRVKPGKIDDEHWHGVVEAHDNPHWLYALARHCQQDQAAEWIKCIFGTATCSECAETFRIMDSVAQNNCF